MTVPRSPAPARLEFRPSATHSVGIEWELALVDAETGDLVQAADEVLEAVRPDGQDAHPRIHPELLLNTVELVTGICATVPEAVADLQRSLEEVRAVTDPRRIEVRVRRPRVSGPQPRRGDARQPPAALTHPRPGPCDQGPQPARSPPRHLGHLLPVGLDRAPVDGARQLDGPVSGAIHSRVPVDRAGPLDRWGARLPWQEWVRRPPGPARRRGGEAPVRHARRGWRRLW
jgi:hypothetical protein